MEERKEENSEGEEVGRECWESKLQLLLMTIKGKRTSHHPFIVAHYILKVAMSATLHPLTVIL